MAHEDLGVLVRVLGGDQVLCLFVQDKVAAEAEDAAQLVLAGDAGEQGHGGALAEAADDDAVGGHAALGDFGVDQLVDVLAGVENARLVFARLQRVESFLLAGEWWVSLVCR